jgi:eight-cysteine-cluster-containing protein
MTPGPGSTRWLLAAAALLGACSPVTDRGHYEVGEQGTVTLLNHFAATTIHLGGCGHFEYEQRIGNEWVAQGSDTVCVWEGLAEPLGPGAVAVDPILAREPGTWRLRYPVGIGCSQSAPLSQCAQVEDLHSNTFEVVAGGCVVTGCSGQICAEEHVGTTCEWRPHYACYRDARCGRFGADGRCGWESTPELAACFEEAGSQSSPR